MTFLLIVAGVGWAALSGVCVYARISHGVDVLGLVILGAIAVVVGMWATVVAHYDYKEEYDKNHITT